MVIETIAAEDVLFIHRRLVEDFAETADPISPSGLRSEALLESAVGRQHVGLGEQSKYPTLHQNAATLLFGLCCDHPFHNGNKRTALVSMLVHLDKNRHTLFGVSQSELFQLMIDVAEHKMSIRQARPKSSVRPPTSDEEVAAIADWIRERMDRLRRGERQITYRQLRQILRNFGFDLDNPKGNSIELLKVTERKVGFIRSRTVVELKHIDSIGYPGDGKFVPLKVLKQVRRRCDLTEELGIDSDAFYDSDAAVDEFINDYRKTLRRLARN